MHLSILIADHDRGLAEAARRCLASRGCEVVVATDGLQCLDELRTVAPVVLVLDPDIQWGGGDGVLDWLDHEDPLMSPIVVLVEGADGSRIPEALHPRVHFRLQRPRSLQELLGFVSHLEAIARGSLLPDRTSEAPSARTVGPAG